MLPPGVLHMSAVGCFGRFTFSHLAFHIPTLAGSCLWLFCVVVCLVALFLCFWFLFCKCLGIPNSPRSLDLDDRQGLIARSAMQQKKKNSGYSKIENLIKSQISAVGITESNGFELLRVIRKEFSLLSRSKALGYREQCVKFRVKKTDHLPDVMREVQTEIDSFHSMLEASVIAVELGQHLCC